MKLVLVVAMALMQTVTLNESFTTTKNGWVLIAIGSVHDFDCYYNELNAVLGPCLPIPKELQ